ncbi:SemiSWEET family sugar transporter [Zobellia alginiliquefaciens]|uniref:SemiSWEET family sugar transporter n=1 Tax=Zobellia alginiliquefaciens TaxID=3032586 RepID=UPI0023E4518A|nr:SemiSWEET transporter [Zobellia alginiliquefaciens]
MTSTETIGLLAGLFTTIAVIPQIAKAIKSGDVGSISPFFFIILIIGVGLWTAYGILKEDWPIIITNGISFSLNVTMLFIYYSKN